MIGKPHSKEWFDFYIKPLMDSILQTNGLCQPLTVTEKTVRGVPKLSVVCGFRRAHTLQFLGLRHKVCQEIPVQVIKYPRGVVELIQTLDNPR